MTVITGMSILGKTSVDVVCDRSEPEDEDQNGCDDKGVGPVPSEIYNPHTVDLRFGRVHHSSIVMNIFTLMSVTLVGLRKKPWLERFREGLFYCNARTLVQARNAPCEQRL
jgi:hypothetical protein